jgi:hypothetical protein
MDLGGIRYIRLTNLKIDQGPRKGCRVIIMMMMLIIIIIIIIIIMLRETCHVSYPNERISKVIDLGPYAYIRIQTKQTPWSESTSELYRPNDRRLSAK